MSHRWQKIVPAVAAALICASTSGVQAQTQIAQVGASASVLIDACPEIVWKTIHEERMHDPDLAYTKILEREGNSSTLEQKFLGVPIIGPVIAVLKEHEIPFRRIDYALIKSDKFKHMEGCWSLTSVRGGKQTLLELTSYLDLGIPFSGPFVKNATERKIDKRIRNVKRVAEREQAEVANRSERDI